MSIEMEKEDNLTEVVQVADSVVLTAVDDILDDLDPKISLNKATITVLHRLNTQFGKGTFNVDVVRMHVEGAWLS